MCLLCAVAVNTLKLKSDVCPWISLPSNHPAANPSCTEVWWPSHCVSVYLPHSKCVLLIKLIIRVKQWQVIKSQTVITAANYRDAHKHELEDGSLQVPSICFPIKFFFQFYSTVMFTLRSPSVSAWTLPRVFPLAYVWSKHLSVYSHWEKQMCTYSHTVA